MLYSSARPCSLFSLDAFCSLLMQILAASPASDIGNRSQFGTDLLSDLASDWPSLALLANIKCHPSLSLQSSPTFSTMVLIPTTIHARTAVTRLCHAIQKFELQRSQAIPLDIAATTIGCHRSFIVCFTIFSVRFPSLTLLFIQLSLANNFKLLESLPLALGVILLIQAISWELEAVGCRSPHLLVFTEIGSLVEQFEAWRNPQ